MDKTINLIKQKGTTLLEALVATAIIGIGFIAIFQMVTYSVRSIDVSGERTKINYLTDTILEDLTAYKTSEKDSRKLYDALMLDDNGDPYPDNAFWNLSQCEADEGITVDPPLNNAEDIIKNKWDNRFSNRRIKCGQDDIKTLKTYTICRDSPGVCTNQNNGVYDKLYFGKLEVLVSGKSKNLYFRIH